MKSLTMQFNLEQFGQYINMLSLVSSERAAVSGRRPSCH